MKAIFLSAGKGTRMMPLTKNTPKPLLDIGEGVTIIENQLDSIVKCGLIKEVVFIIGYRAEQIEAKLKNYDKLLIRFIYNPFYDISNNLISLWLASYEMKTDFVSINGDNIFKPEVLTRLINESQDKEIIMVIDRKKKYDDEDMKVITINDKVKSVSKKIPNDKANGESIGMIRYTRKGKEIIRNTLNQMVREESSKHVFYLEALQKIMHSGFPVYYTECKEDDWTEIDFHPDLQLIRKEAFK